MSTIRDMKLNPQDVLGRMSTNVLRSAYDRGLTLSAFLEQQNPEHEYKDGLDGFQRLLHLSGIRTSSVPEIGLSASTWDEFNASPQLRVLAYEWAARTWRMLHGWRWSRRHNHETEVEIAITNRMPYTKWVKDERYQARIHQGRHVTVQAVQRQLARRSQGIWQRYLRAKVKP